MSGTEGSTNESLDDGKFNEHVPVLLDEVIGFVENRHDMVVVDMTLGRGGHSSKIMEKAKDATLYGFDRDMQALAYCEDKFKNVKHSFFHERFSNAIDTLKDNGIEGADFILFDIGVSSPQFDDPRRGFSYRYDAMLDMRMDLSQSLTAKDVVNTYSAEELKRILFQYGGEKFAGPIARKIVEERKKKPIETTYELVEVIKSALPERILHQKGHPAKQTFMALRYEVNDEKNELTKGLEAAIGFLRPKGRVLVIAFNSEEDTMVRNTFQRFCPKQIFDKYLPIDKSNESPYVILTKKAIVPTKQEEERNPRSKCATLRVIERRQ